MSTTLLVILVAIGVVGFFMLGMSLTLIFKGHNIDSEISTNKEMPALTPVTNGSWVMGFPCSPPR